MGDQQFFISTRRSNVVAALAFTLIAFASPCVTLALAAGDGVLLRTLTASEARERTAQNPDTRSEEDGALYYANHAAQNPVLPLAEVRTQPARNNDRLVIRPAKGDANQLPPQAPEAKADYLSAAPPCTVAADDGPPSKSESLSCPARPTTAQDLRLAFACAPPRV